MALWGCFHLMEFEFEFVVYFGRGGRVLKSGLIFANPSDHWLLGLLGVLAQILTTGVKVLSKSRPAC